MKKYFNIGTTNKNDICMDYIGMDSYNPNGTIKASNKCKRCHRHKFIDCDSNGHYVECDTES